MQVRTFERYIPLNNPSNLDKFDDYFNCFIYQQQKMCICYCLNHFNTFIVPVGGGNNINLFV